MTLFSIPWFSFVTWLKRISELDCITSLNAIWLHLNFMIAKEKLSSTLIHISHESEQKRLSNEEDKSAGRESSIFLRGNGMISPECCVQNEGDAEYLFM